MLPLTVEAKMRAKYRTMQTSDLKDLLDRQKRLLNFSSDLSYLTRYQQKIKMIEDELKSREKENIANV